jgi:hypothetical protein
MRKDIFQICQISLKCLPRLDMVTLHEKYDLAIKVVEAIKNFVSEWSNRGFA